MTCSDIEKRLISSFVLPRFWASWKNIATNTDCIFQDIFFWLRLSNVIVLVSANFTSTSWLLSCHPTTLFRSRVAWNNVKLQNLDNGSTYKVDYRLISSFGRAPVCNLSGKSRVQTLAGTTLRVFKQLKRNSCPCNNICKPLDFLVFSDKDEKKKREVPSQSTFTYLVFVGSKRTRHCSKRVEDVGPGGGVTNLSWARWVDYPVRRDINIGITSYDPPYGVVMATDRQHIWRRFTASQFWEMLHWYFILYLSRDHVLTMLHLAPIFFGGKLAFWGEAFTPQIP